MIRTPIASIRCALCSEIRTSGCFLHLEPLGDKDKVEWVCQDCQNKLARKVDDEGTRGG